MSNTVRSVFVIALALTAYGAVAAELLYSSMASGSMQLHSLVENQVSARALTKAPGDNDNAVWSNNGSRIAFVSTRDGRPQVYTMNADGTDQRRVSMLSEESSGPAWSADSQSLVYASYRDGGYGVYMQDLAAGKEQLVLAAEGGVAGLAWSPGGEKLAFATTTGSRKATILIVDLRTGKSLQLPAANGTSNIRPVWSPDGSRLAFVASAGRQGINIFTCRPDGSDMKAITQTIYSSASPVWSPDGRYLAFTSNLEFGDRSEIFVADMISGEIRNLTRHEHEDAEPAWAPNSRSIYFVSFRSGISQLYRIGLDGSTALVSLVKSYESTPLPRPLEVASIASAIHQVTQADRPFRRE